MLRAEIGEAAGAAEADAADARAEVLHLRDALSQLEAALRDSEAKRCGLPENPSVAQGHREHNAATSSVVVDAAASCRPFQAQVGRLRRELPCVLARGSSLQAATMITPLLIEGCIAVLFK